MWYFPVQIYNLRRIQLYKIKYQLIKIKNSCPPEPVPGVPVQVASSNAISVIPSDLSSPPTAHLALVTWRDVDTVKPAKQSSAAQLRTRHQQPKH